MAKEDVKRSALAKVKVGLDLVFTFLATLVALHFTPVSKRVSER